jgi:hypothetical protein
MDVGPFVVPEAQAAKLIQPGEGSLDNPTPPPLEPVTNLPTKAAATTRFESVLRRMVNTRRVHGTERRYAA